MPCSIKGCRGPSGEEDKCVKSTNDEMCNECRDQLLLDASDEAGSAQVNDGQHGLIRLEVSNERTFYVSEHEKRGGDDSDL